MNLRPLGMCSDDHEYRLLGSPLIMQRAQKENPKISGVKCGDFEPYLLQSFDCLIQAYQCAGTVRFLAHSRI